MLSTFAPTAQNFGRLPQCWGQILGAHELTAYVKTATSGPSLITLGHKSTLQYPPRFQFWPSSNKNLTATTGRPRSSPATPSSVSPRRDPTMPGTIQVSVLELVDLPPPPAPCPSEANSSFVSLKVVMGKREYQSVGRGHFLFPVTSLRENLILMLHDMAGNLLSRTEFKIRLVVEKGIWDDVFPLEGGGSVRMKLQFVLSEEERQRIHEMRYSALKRKHMELLKGGCESPVSELNAEGDGIGRLKQIDPDVPDFTGVDEEKNKTQTAPGGIIERQFSSCEGLDPHIGCLGSPISGNVTTDSISVSAELDDHICSPKKKNLLERGSSSSVRKIISAFENSLFQGTGYHVGQGSASQSSKLESGGSTKRTSSEESVIRKLKFPQTMAKSFSAEMLSEIDSQCNPMFVKSPFLKKQERLQYFNNVTRQEMIGKNRPFRNFAANQNFKSFKPDKQKSVGVANDGSSSLESLHTAQSHNSKNIDTVSESVNTENVVSFGGSAEHMSKRKEPISIEKKVNMGSFPNECHSLIACTVQKIPGERSLVYDGEKLKALGTRRKPCETEQTGSLGGSVRNISEREDSLASKVGKSPLIISKHRKSSAFEEKPKVNIFLKEAYSLDAHTSSLCTCNQGSAINAFTNESDRRCYRSHVEERIISRNSEFLELLSSYREKCLFGKVGVWVPRHLCITTGSKQLMNLVESCSLCLGTPPSEKNPFTTEANKK
ncbi:uncharacterized protein LOC103712837 isoform X2 [Phoenix dactylifera]|nr:uncharacterized protein LOC103712837 isoform X2 [Phoenix dactylifera]